jgi:ribonuclease P protein component
VLAQTHRLRNSKDFARVTKTGFRATSQHLVVYAAVSPTLTTGPQVGLIINKSVGGSVTRHRVARQLRHSIKTELHKFSPAVQLVIRVLRPIENYSDDLAALTSKIAEKIQVRS